MLIEDRRRRLLEVVNHKGSLTVAEAEKALEVSRMTVHRDLDVLAAQGLVRKVHGGVVAVGQRGADLFDPRAQSFEERLAVARESKRAIVRHVAKLVSKANTLLLDASTTVYFLSEHLHGDEAQKRDLYIVTGSLPLFTELVRRRDGLRVALHGGEPHVRTGSLIGPLAENSLADMRFDFVVLSGLGVMEEEGTLFVASAEEAAVKRVYIEHARKRILVADSSKFGRSGVHPCSPTSVFDWIVTEKGPMTQQEFAARTRRGGLSNGAKRRER